MNALPQRFLDKVDKTNSCWLWTAALSNGYGRFSLNGEILSAHRVSYIDDKGPIPEGLELDHLCRVKHYINPAHLEAVSHQVNVQRGCTGETNRKRQSAKTHCPQGHPYSGDNLYIFPNGGRACRTCNRESKRKFSARKKEELINIR